MTEATDGFAAFVAARGPALKRSALLLLAGDQHLAEDLVQTTLAKASLRWSKISRVEAPAAYVNRMLMNECRSFMRSGWRRERPTDTPPTDRPVAEPSFEDRHLVFDALRQLPPRQRAVIVLRYYEDLTEQQSATLLGCSIGTIKSQHAKALKKLRSTLDSEGPLKAGTVVPPGGN